MSEVKIQVGTADMPVPQILSYSTTYRVTPLFMKDLQTVIGDLAYADVKSIIETIKGHNYILPIAVLNEMIRTLGGLPYKHIAPLMHVIEQVDNFKKYFIELDVHGDDASNDVSTKN